MPSLLFLGATSDIAIETARIFGEKHFDIYMAGRDIEYLNKLKKDFEIRYNISANIIHFDALNFTEHRHFIDSLIPFPDVTICAFGYLGDQQRAQLDWSEAKLILETNFSGAVSILNEVANLYERQKRGTIVGITSVAGDRGRQSNYLYGSAKAGFSTYLSGLRQRLYPSGVNVISIKPGFVRTKMTEHLELPRFLTADPKQVAKKIEAGISKQANIIYVKAIWRYVMLIIKLIPENIFKRTRL